MIRDAGDIIDRLCIAQLKMEKIGSPESKKEFSAFFEGLFTLMLVHQEINWWEIIIQMLKYHKDIWDLEASVRQGKLDNNVQEVGIRAIKIREINHLRVRLKNYINKLVGEGFQDQKKYHASE